MELRDVVHASEVISLIRVYTSELRSPNVDVARVMEVYVVGNDRRHLLFFR